MKWHLAWRSEFGDLAWVGEDGSLVIEPNVSLDDDQPTAVILPAHVLSELSAEAQEARCHIEQHTTEGDDD